MGGGGESMERRCRVPKSIWVPQNYSPVREGLSPPDPGEVWSKAKVKPSSRRLSLLQLPPERVASIAFVEQVFSEGKAATGPVS